MKEWLNQFLVFDFFFVLVSFFWFVIAVLGHTQGLSLGLELWYKLWTPLFQPAIGILMAGALLSALFDQINKRFGTKS